MPSPDPTKPSKPMPAREEKLIALQPEPRPMAPTIGTSSFQSLFFGPAAGQPSQASFDQRPSLGKKIFLLVLSLGLMFVAVRTVMSMFRG